MKKILLVEDDPGVSSFVNRGLTEEGFDVSIALDGEIGLSMALSGNFDLIILDVMLPKVHGLEICRQIRNTNKQVAILMLTALGSSENIVTGLNAGADDYMAKPFKFTELEARINALARRAGQEQKPAEIITIDNLEIDRKAKTVKREGELISLTAKEFKLLYYLAKNTGITLSREKILDNVWNINFDMNTNVVDVYINYLRKKIDKPYSVKLIHTIKGLGYVLKP